MSHSNLKYNISTNLKNALNFYFNLNRVHEIIHINIVFLILLGLNTNFVFMFIELIEFSLNTCFYLIWSQFSSIKQLTLSD